MSNDWLILTREGTPAEPETCLPRPDDANPDEGNVYTPWYQSLEHIHIEGGVIYGIHAKGEHGELAAILRHIQKYEPQILSHFILKPDWSVPNWLAEYQSKDGIIHSLPLLEVLKFITSYSYWTA